MRQGPGVTSGLGGIGVISVGPSLGVDPPEKMRLRISNKQKYDDASFDIV